MTKNELRKALKAMGYNCAFNTQESPFSGGRAITFVSLILPNGHKTQITSASVFGAGFYAEHREAFKLVEEYKKGAGTI
jgi:hypothetical protein